MKQKRKYDTRSKTIRVDSIGPVLLEKSRRARHIIISIKPFRGIRVAVPAGVSFKAARDFIQTKTEWIHKNLSKIRSLEQKHAESLKHTQIVHPQEARKILVKRLDRLSEKYDLPYNRVFIRNQKTRWGSCSGKNNINLNMNLVRLPNRLIDYTILHELVHTRIKNHGKDFWAELEKYVKNARQLDKELNQYFL